MVLSCHKATFLIEKSYDKPLSFIDKLQLSIHLKICDKCAGYQKQSLLIERVIKSNRQPISNTSNYKLSTDSRNRIQRALDENSKKM